MILNNNNMETMLYVYDTDAMNMNAKCRMKNMQ